MTSEQRISEGRKLARPCVLLRPRGAGPFAAVWYERDQGEIESHGERCWLTVDARRIPGLTSTVSGYLNIYTDESKGRGGRVEVVQSWSARAGMPLYAHSAAVLPPIDAVFARGADALGEWIASHGWRRSDPYNDNFGGKSIVAPYQRTWFEEFPLYNESDVYAALGGWHVPWPDDNWHDLIDDQLMVFTIRDSEPWVEAWHTRTGEFKVIQRIT